ncbi:hypothetical protein CGCA056_v014991 [Colletotrichum aenigma]|uniref:uncharacterized protein n=1 Tax=Colletotrichum aenigma TaxID=1215731 RepID=UPI001872F7BB|nr:uncharacterized protein CGCA056_v014991 [Colletotrichum aenigma]KAF5498164.1 hypothetical protein CGCA056_v014991 [Colletotrichum aenigma]
MASQPPAGSGPLPASSAGPDRGSRAPLEPSPTSRAKRRRGTEAQLSQPSLAGSQPDASTTTPLTAKGPSTVNRIAAGAILTALNEEAKHYEARKDVFMAIAQSVDNMVSCFEGPRKQIAKEATTYEDLRVFARIPEEGLTAARKHTPFALRRKVCQALSLQLADIPHIYHITTSYSLRPLNKQVQQALLTNKQKLADSLGAYKVKSPTKWFTYVVPRCPAKMWTLEGDTLDLAALVEDEVLAQTGLKPTQAQQSRLGPLCGNCSRPSGSHETWPCTARPKCANCASPFQANHKDCPARPLVVNGSPTLPGRKELSWIRKAGQKAYEALYQSSQAGSQATCNQQPSSSLTSPQPSSKRPRAPTPTQDSIIVADVSDTASSSSMDEDENEAEAEVSDNNPILPPLPTQHIPAASSSRAQRVAQKPDYNVVNAYTHLDLDSEQ